MDQPTGPGSGEIRDREQQANEAADEHYERLHFASGHRGRYKQCDLCREKEWR